MFYRYKISYFTFIVRRTTVKICNGNGLAFVISAQSERTAILPPRKVMRCWMSP